MRLELFLGLGLLVFLRWTVHSQCSRGASARIICAAAGGSFGGDRFVCRRHRIAAGDRAVRDDFVQREASILLGAQLRQHLVAQQRRELLQRHRLFGGVDNGFDFCFQAHVESQLSAVSYQLKIHSQSILKFTLLFVIGVRERLR